MNIHKELQQIFPGAQMITEDEIDVIEDALTFMRDDEESGADEAVLDLWACKINGIAEFLSASGRISEEQEKEITKLVKRIARGATA